jgi:hypothetical protein
MDRWMDGWIVRRMDGWIYGHMHGWNIDRCLDGLIDGWMEV